MAETTEELRKRPEIRKELDRARGEKRPEKVETHGRDRFWFMLAGRVKDGAAGHVSCRIAAMAWCGSTTP